MPQPPVPISTRCARRSAEGSSGPGDQDWDEARQAWNLAVDQRPVAVVFATSADDVAADGPVRGRGRRPRDRTGQRPRRVQPRHAGRHRPDQDERDERGWRSTPRTAPRGSRRASWPATWRPRRASTAWPRWAAPRPTWAWWATRSAAGWAGWGGPHGFASNAVRAIEMVTADGELVRAERGRAAGPVLGRCAAAAARSPSSPPWR